MSSGETNLRPTAMLFRNLISMDVEESIRANPIDGVVLLTGCDKTVPALVMGAASVDLPSIVISGGADAERQVLRSGARIGHRRVALQRGDARRPHDTGAVHGRADRHEPVGWRLQCHGHGVDDGDASGSARVDAAAQRRDPRPRLAPPDDGALDRTPHRRDGARGSQDVEDPHASGVRERDPRERRRRRIDQRRHPFACDRRAHRRRRDAARLGRVRPRCADAARSQALRPLLDGGLLLRRWIARDHPRARREGLAEQGRAHGQRQEPSGRTARTRRPGTPRSFGRSTSRWSRAAASRSCAATSRRTARC